MGPERREVAHIIFHTLDIDRAGGNAWDDLLEILNLAGGKWHAAKGRELAIEETGGSEDEWGEGCGLSCFYRFINTLYSDQNEEEFEHTMSILETGAKLVAFDKGPSHMNEDARIEIVQELAERKGWRGLKGLAQK